MFKKIGIILIAALYFASCQENTGEGVSISYDDLCINEICSDTDKEWVELFNRSDESLNISGVKLVLNGKQVLHTAPNGSTLSAKSHMVFDRVEGTINGAMPLDQPFVLSLVSPANDTIDVFDRDKTIGVNKTHPINASYARIPDGRSFWEITRCPTKGFKNNEEKNCDPRTFDGLILNEVCAKTNEEWIEVYNSTSSAMDISGVSIVYKDHDKENKLLTIPNNTVLNANSYIVFEKSEGALSINFPMDKYMEFSLVSPKNVIIDLFNRDDAIAKNKAHPTVTDGSYARVPNGSSTWEISRSPTKGSENKNEDLRTFEGFIINEVRATTGDEWIEAFNSTSSLMDISGVTIVYKNSQNQEQTLYKIPDYTILGSRTYIVFDKVTGVLSGIFPMDKSIEVSLVSPKNVKIDVFNRDQAIGVNIAHSQSGSFSRFPNASATWVATVLQTRNAENKYATYEEYLAKMDNIGIWMRGEHFRDATAQTFQNLANYGIGHIIVNEAAMRSYGMSDAAFIQKTNLANSHGLKVHIWFQCFYANSVWIPPIIDCQFNQSYYNEMIIRAERYVRFGNIAGIHLDYIRYPGTAYNFNCNATVTGENAIAEFCRQISDAVKAIDPNVKLSAALMFETTANAYYYGQNTRKMAKHLDILMPMVYRYSFGSTAVDRGESWITNTTKWFADEVKASGEDCEVWAGILTYRPLAPNDTQIEWLTAARLEVDCRLALRRTTISYNEVTGATGVVLFRFNIVNYFNVASIFF